MLQHLIDNAFALSPTALSFADKNLKDEGMQMLCMSLLQMLSTNEGKAKLHQVKTLDFRGNSIALKGVEALMDLCSHLPSLTLLNLEWNQLNQSGAMTLLGKWIANNESLEHLDLRNNKLSSDDAVNLSRALTRNRSLRHVDLRWNEIGSIGLQAMASALLQNTTLTSLMVSGNGVDTVSSSNLIKTIGMSPPTVCVPVC